MYAAMRENRTRAVLEKGLPVIGTMIQGIRSPAGTIIMANAGFDFILLDLEHGVLNIETTADLIQVIRLAGVTPLVRVADGLYHLIAPVLDAGAEGIMIPRVVSPEQVEYSVSCVKYPPAGQRGCSVARGHNDYRSAEMHAFTQHANRQNLVIIQIERQAAVENIDALVSVPGVDVALIGPNDLALSLGIPMDMQHETMKTAIGRVVESCTRHGVYSGIHVSDPEVLLDWHSRGMRVLAYSSDLSMLATAAGQGISVLRKGIAGE
jgi:2-keto-3-deoxy-L-rhamnonate aldolase RhmA